MYPTRGYIMVHYRYACRGCRVCRGQRDVHVHTSVLCKIIFRKKSNAHTQNKHTKKCEGENGNVTNSHTFSVCAHLPCTLCFIVYLSLFTFRSFTHFLFVSALGHRRRNVENRVVYVCFYNTSRTIYLFSIVIQETLRRENYPTGEFVCLFYTCRILVYTSMWCMVCIGFCVSQRHKHTEYGFIACISFFARVFHFPCSSTFGLYVH